MFLFRLNDYREWHFYSLPLKGILSLIRLHDLSNKK
jgi:hypothetical protein